MLVYVDPNLSVLSYMFESLDILVMDYIAHSILFIYS